MPLPELLEWYEIAANENKSEQKRAETERKRLEEQARMRRGR
jgi:hypothetical protein